MALIIFLLPFVVTFLVLGLYRHNGKKEIFKLDVVQFVYGFVIYPVVFLWLKTFLYILLKQELGNSLSLTSFFVIDTAFSTFLLLLYALVIIHSLTKTFNLKYYRDPLYDVFEHSEYYHLWLTHVGIYFGLMAAMTLMSFVNMMFPITWVVNSIQFYGLLMMGLVVGLLSFVGVWLSDPDQAQFIRIMKLAFALFFFFHVLMYFGFDPSLTIHYGIYWFVFMAFTGTVFCSYVFHRSQKAIRLANKFKHKLWEKKLVVMK